MDLGLRRRSIRGPDDEAWRWSRVLYAYLHPETSVPLYVGKTWGTTVRSRWDAPDKLNGVWPYLERLGIDRHQLVVGEPEFAARLTHELLADVESLLIFAMQPVANIASRASRISRPGLIVRNSGAVWRGPLQIWDGVRCDGRSRRRR